MLVVLLDVVGGTVVLVVLLVVVVVGTVVLVVVLDVVVVGTVVLVVLLVVVGGTVVLVVVLDVVVGGTVVLVVLLVVLLEDVKVVDVLVMASVEVVVGRPSPMCTGCGASQSRRSAMASQPGGPPDNRPVQRQVTPGVQPPPRSQTPVRCPTSRQSLSVAQILYFVGSVLSHQPILPWMPMARMRQVSATAIRPS